MRSCRFYISRNFLCVISNLSEHYEQYFRSKRFCELTPPNAEIERLLRQKKKFFDKAIKAKAKITRFAKQYKLIMQKLRELDRREKQNILKLKINEIMANRAVKENRQLLTLKVLNSPSPRSFSFTVPVIGKGSTNPFLRLLNSLNKNAEIS
jgi:hypothetical protein